MIIKYKKLYDNAYSPVRGHYDDAGADLMAVSKKWNEEYQVWEYGTGIAIELPKGVWADIRPRSSIYKTGLVLCNSCGVCDHGYTGELMAKFYHVIKTSKEYDIGDRICQLIISNIDPEELEFVEVTELNKTLRGKNGFGSTGK